MLNKFIYTFILLLFSFSVNEDLHASDARFNYKKTQLVCKDLQEDYEDIRSSLEHEENWLREILTEGNPWNKGVVNGYIGLKILNTEFALSDIHRRKSDIYRTVKILFSSNNVTCPIIIPNHVLPPGVDPYQGDALQTRLDACIKWSEKMERLISECQISSKDLTWSQYEKYSILRDYNYDESLQYFRWTHEICIWGVNGDIKKHIDNFYLSLPLLISQGEASGNIRNFLIQIFMHYSLNVIDNYFLIERISMRAEHHLDLFYFYKDVLRNG